MNILKSVIKKCQKKDFQKSSQNFSILTYVIERYKKSKF